MVLRVTKRIARAYLEALLLSTRVKPFQVAKRRVFTRYRLLGTQYDRIFTALSYRMQRLQGLLDKVINERLGLRLEDLRELLQPLRFVTVLALFDRVGDEEFRSSLIANMSKVLNSIKPGYGDIVWRYYKSLASKPWTPRNEIERDEFRLLMPRTLIERLRKLLPAREIEEFARAVNTDRPVLGFRVNRLKASVEEVLLELRRMGVEAWPSMRVGYHVQYRGPLDYSRLRLLREGKVVPQDEASAAAGEILGAKPGELIVDMCAAPGGKTTHLAELSNVASRIIAIDVLADRIKRLVVLARRTGTWPAIHPVRFDAIFASRLVRQHADKVLLDPPCTSTGAIAKHPEARWRLTESSILKHVGIQRRMLVEAVEALKPGGLLLYTVCSVLPEEGEENIEWLLSVRKDVEIVPLKSPYDESPLLKGTMRAWPHRHGVTGFFYALIQKKS